MASRELKWTRRTTENGGSASQPPLFEWAGHCPICESQTIFRAWNPWFRDYLICTTCENFSLPRERALAMVVKRLFPGVEANDDPRILAESARLLSPHAAGTGYVGTQFMPDVPLGHVSDGVRCEDLERQTFADETFDLIITQDVFEHLFEPDVAHREIWRTLKPGGAHCFTTPTYPGMRSERRARRLHLRHGPCSGDVPKFSGSISPLSRAAFSIVNWPDTRPVASLLQHGVSVPF
jgi:SAM-dependent methyltransferase